MEIEQEEDMLHTNRVQVHHFVNMTVGRMAVEYANIRYATACIRLVGQYVKVGLALGSWSK